MGIAPSTNYYYQVRAFNSFGFSAVSNTASTTSGTIPSAPSGLTAIASSSQAVLNWTDTSSNENMFSVERAVGTSSFAVIGTTTPNATFYVDSPSSGSYSYRIQAVNGYGSSGYTNIATVTIP
jgi:titin